MAGERVGEIVEREPEQEGPTSEVRVLDCEWQVVETSGQRVSWAYDSLLDITKPGVAERWIKRRPTW